MLSFARRFLASPAASAGKGKTAASAAKTVAAAAAAKQQKEPKQSKVAIDKGKKEGKRRSKEGERKQMKIEVVKVKADGTTRRFYKEAFASLRPFPTENETHVLFNKETGKITKVTHNNNNNNKDNNNKEKPFYSVILDKWEIETASKGIVGSEHQNLSRAIAFEWNSQGKFIIPATMPLLVLTCTAIDLARNPKSLDYMRENLLRKFEQEPLCLRAPEPRELFELENQKWNPILEWAEKELQLSLQPTTDIFGFELAEKTRKRAVELLAAMDSYDIAVLDMCCGATGSFVLGIAFLRGFLSPPEVAAAARLHERYQMERWGTVEGGHDMDEVDIRVRLSSASLLLHLIEKL